jgi:hypothetical protein
MRFGVLALAGATTLSLAACGTSNNATPTQSGSPTTTAAPTQAAPTQAAHPPRRPLRRPAGAVRGSPGLIASVAGDAIQVTQQNGTATVDFTSSTQVSEVTSAGLPDVTAGSCITVRPTRDNPQNGGAITAGMVRISPAANGQCPQPNQPPAGGSGTPRHPGIQGTVASVAGNTITVNTTNPGQTTVTVSDRTRYSKEAAADSQAIAQGKCIAAQGTEGSGALQATTISLRPANNGSCGGPGGGPHRH